MNGKTPRHVAIIMDGNGRWAEARGLPRVAGHEAGVQSVREVVKAALELEVPVLTLYAFSQENWKRPREEVSFLMNLLGLYLEREIRALHEQGVSFRTIGRTLELGPEISKKLDQAQRLTQSNRKLILNLALNYGARTEILDAVTKIVTDAQKGLVTGAEIEHLSEEFFSTYLYTAGLPDPDLLIRTSGEMRLSNFLLWQLSYAEIYITKKFWPEFSQADFLEAVEEYGRRERRFGGVEAGAA